MKIKALSLYITSRMARHSKNNTAHSIFTQGEKNMVKDWGTVRQRIGAESFKALDQCCLCLSTVHSPVICSKGHIFCRECLIRNFLEQKERIRTQQAKWQRHVETQAAKQVAEEEQRESLAKEEFIRVAEKLPSAAQWQAFEEDRRYGLMGTDEAALTRARDNIKAHKTISEDSLRREEMIKQSFWVPETAPTAAEPIATKPDPHTVCPIAPKHHCKLSKTIAVFLKRDADSSVLCWHCGKSLTHHAAGVLSHCGHLLCQSCQGFAAETCPSCGVPSSPASIIPLVQKGTMFAAHNEVEAAIKNPVFIC